MSKLSEAWWTAPAEGENGETIMVTGRSDIERFRKNPKMNIRVEVSWKYAESGMPSDDLAESFDIVQQRLTDAFDKDPVAILTGIFTGEGQRDWIFYTLSTNIFGRKLNEALNDLPTLPLTIYCENDPNWAAYDEMAEHEIKA